MALNKIKVNDTTTVNTGVVYDITKATGQSYGSLPAALGTDGNNVPSEVREGGMTIRYVSNSDNKYVQYRLAASGWSTDIRDWTSEDPYFIDKIMQEVNEAIDEHTPIEITGDVTNAPDEEDLTSVNVGGTDVLKFKDKTYNPLTYSGMGRIILRKNIVDGVNMLTRVMLTQQNTIYVIRYDFTLDEDITVPANCVLEFDGGSLSGAYTINGQNTGIRAGLVKIFNTNVILAGIWNVTEAYPQWFGAKGDGVNDDTDSIQAAIHTGLNINFPSSNQERYYITKTININAGDSTCLDGDIIKNTESFLIIKNGFVGTSIFKVFVPGLRVQSLSAYSAINDSSSRTVSYIDIAINTSNDCDAEVYNCYIGGESLQYAVKIDGRGIKFFNNLISCYRGLYIYWSENDNWENTEEAQILPRGVRRYVITNNVTHTSALLVYFDAVDLTTKSTPSGTKADLCEHGVVPFHTVEITDNVLDIGTQLIITSNKTELNGAVISCNNVLNSNLGCIEIDGIVTDSLISNNYFSANKTWVGVTNLFFGSVYNSSIKDNIINGAGRNAVYINNSYNVVITGNHIIDFNLENQNMRAALYVNGIINGLQFVYNTLSLPTIIEGTRYKNIIYLAQTKDNIQNIQVDKNICDADDYVLNGVVRGSNNIIDQILDSSANVTLNTAEVRTSGPTSLRPIFPSRGNRGRQYFDETLNKPIYWNGTAWVDATGTPV